MRFLVALTLSAALVAACTGSASMPTGPTMTPSGSPAAGATIAGTWVGTSADSSGTMMGTGMSQSMMANMTWQLTQSGNTFTGAMQFPGSSDSAIMSVSGTINGNTAVNMKMEVGGMMMGTCTAVATGTFDMDELMTQIHGSYEGSNSCTGAFTRGQVSMTRRGSPRRVVRQVLLESLIPLVMSPSAAALSSSRTTI